VHSCLSITPRDHHGRHRRLDSVQAVWTGEAYRAFRERLYSSDPPAACRNCGLAWSL